MGQVSIARAGCIFGVGKIAYNMFISGGGNIVPAKIKRVLLTAPGVLDMVVVSRSDDEYGFCPVAFICGDVNRSVVKAYLEQALPRPRCPCFGHGRTQT